jgi:hypothetical protein
MKRIGWATLGLSLAAIGCARGPDVAVNALALQRVVIYRNGVGYFERRGKIDADSVTFQVRTERVGDFLATLAVMEQGGSSVHSASFPVDLDKKKAEDADDEEADDEPSEKSDLPVKPPKKKKKKKDDKDSLEEVKLTLDGKEHDLTVGYVAETPVWRPSYRLVVHARDVGAKAGDKPIAGGAELQAWGIVQNTSGEDWKGIRLSLVAGAPLAFQATLEKAVVPLRPTVTDQGEVISSVPTGETTLVDRPTPKTPPVVVGTTAPSNGPVGGVTTLDQLAEKKEAEEVLRGAAHARRKEEAKKPAKTRAPGTKGDSDKDARDRPYEQPPPPPMAPAAAAVSDAPAQPTSTPRDVRALAAVAMEAGTTRYDLPFAVDVPNHSATMVLLVAKAVPGESIYLFAPDGGVPGSLAHPFRVARFTNDTKGLLEKGPIAVFENGSFLGQGMVDPLPPGATATVPFALERSLAVESAKSENEEGSRLAKIEGGRIEIERDWVTHTKYTVKNGSDLDARVLVKHARLYGSRLHEAPRGTEDNTGTMSALVPVGVARGGNAILDVDERRENRRQIDPLDPLADDAVKAYLADSRADKDVVILLRPAWEARAKLRVTVDEKGKLETEKYALEQQIGQLDRSLKAIEKNALAAQLRKDLTDRLGKAHGRLDEVVKRLVVVEMQASEQAIRFRDLLNAIKMVKPLSTDKI